MTYNEEIVDLLHRLGKDALLTHWSQSDDSVLIYKDFWGALSDTLQVLGIKVECPLCREEKEHEDGWAYHLIWHRPPRGLCSDEGFWVKWRRKDED